MKKLSPEELQQFVYDVAIVMRDNSYEGKAANFLYALKKERNIKGLYDFFDKALQFEFTIPLSREEARIARRFYRAPRIERDDDLSKRAKMEFFAKGSASFEKYGRRAAMGLITGVITGTGLSIGEIASNAAQDENTEWQIKLAATMTTILRWYSIYQKSNFSRQAGMGIPEAHQAKQQVLDDAAKKLRLGFIEISMPTILDGVDAYLRRELNLNSNIIRKSVNSR